VTGGIRNNLATQIIILGATLPILLYWGTPLSPLTLIGTLLHGVLLSLYLSLSSLFWLLLIITNNSVSFSALMEYTTQWWNVLLQPAEQIPYIICHPSTGYIILGASLCIYILYQYKSASTAAVGGVFAITIALLFLFSYIQFPTQFTIGKRTLQLNPSHQNIVYIHDHNYIAFLGSVQTFVQYTLVPHITRTYGMPKKIVVIQSGSYKQEKALQSELEKYYRVSIARTYKNY